VYHKTHFNGAIGSLHMTKAEIETLIELFDKVLDNPDIKFGDDHVVWDRTVYSTMTNLIQLKCSMK